MESQTPTIGKPVFKKRQRQGRAKARKRSRTSEQGSAEESETVDKQLLLTSIKRDAAENERAWQKEDYSVIDTKTKEIEEDASKKPGVVKDRSAFAPTRAPTNIRTTVKVDYQPDVCKDYKETGYCGFGDSCKFLHDRSDYKAGWQIDRDWAAKEKERRDKLLRGEDPDSVNAEPVPDADKDEDGLPFACYICRGDFKRPVITLCEHYFCEDCAVVRLQKHSTCAICNKQLRGTLNSATKLLTKMKSKR